MAEILVVDNNKCITELIKEVLGSDGHNVAIAQTGNQAESLFKAKDFDVAFIDIGLPDANGLNLVSKIKQANPDTKAVIVSGKSDNETIIRSFRAGAADYLLKPFDIDDLLRLAGSRRNDHFGREITLHRRTSASQGRPTRFLSKITGHLPAPALMAAALFINFQFLPIPDIQRENAAIKIVLLLASFVCCYGFAISTARFWSRFINSKTAAGHRLVSITIAHVLYLIVLYFANPYIDLRPALALSWLALTASVYLAQQKIISSVIRNLAAAKEGRHRLIFGNPPTGDRAPTPIKEHQSASNEKHGASAAQMADSEMEASVDRENEVPLSV
mgnify:CR=1 FL=1